MLVEVLAREIIKSFSPGYPISDSRSFKRMKFFTNFAAIKQKAPLTELSLLP